MYKIGLTGGIASGKSTVLNWFKNHGIAYVDADVVARDIVEPGKPLFCRMELLIAGPWGI